MATFTCKKIMNQTLILLQLNVPIYTKLQRSSYPVMYIQNEFCLLNIITKMYTQMDSAPAPFCFPTGNYLNNFFT
jgi:hypothetical protein